MARKDGHNIGCGAIIAIEIVCTIITVIIAMDLKVKNPFGPIIVGLIIGYIIASYVNSSDRFKDL